MAGGNPNPDVKKIEKHQFRPGQSGNPGGITKEERARIRENGERATRIRAMYLEALEKKLADAISSEDSKTVFEIKAEINTLLRDTENRSYGTPTQSVQMSGPDGEPIATITGEMSPEQAAQVYQRMIQSGPEAVEDDQSVEE